MHLGVRGDAQLMAAFGPRLAVRFLAFRWLFSSKTCALSPLNSFETLISGVDPLLGTTKSLMHQIMI
jgi:hypothetical protein